MRAAEPVERPARPELVTIGIVRRPHGLAGEVRIRPETDFPERFAALRRAYLVRGDEATAVEVEGVRGDPRGPLVKFRGVDTPEAAGAWRGALLAVTRDAVHPLPEGAHYVFEIVGLRAETTAGAALGVVTEVMRGDAHDVYVVRTPDGRDMLLPALRQVVRQVDVAGGRIVVEPPPEFDEA